MKIIAASLVLALALAGCKSAPPAKQAPLSLEEKEAAIAAAEPQLMTVKVGQELKLFLGPQGTRSGPSYKVDGYSPYLRDVLRERAYPAFEDGKFQAVLLGVKPGKATLKVLKNENWANPSWDLLRTVQVQVVK